MHKRKLRLESLRVETFETTTTRAEKGTVFGEQCTCGTVCSCPGQGTCDASCNFSCNISNCNDYPTCVGGNRCISETTCHQAD